MCGNIRESTRVARPTENVNRTTLKLGTKALHSFHEFYQLLGNKRVFEFIFTQIPSTTYTHTCHDENPPIILRSIVSDYYSRWWNSHLVKGDSLVRELMGKPYCVSGNSDIFPMYMDQERTEKRKVCLEVNNVLGVWYHWALSVLVIPIHIYICVHRHMQGWMRRRRV